MDTNIVVLDEENCNSEYVLDIRDVSPLNIEYQTNIKTKNQSKNNKKQKNQKIPKTQNNQNNQNNNIINTTHNNTVNTDDEMEKTRCIMEFENIISMEKYEKECYMNMVLSNISVAEHNDINHKLALENTLVILSKCQRLTLETKLRYAINQDWTFNQYIDFMLS